MTDLKIIDLERDTFEANGTTYHIKKSLSISRYIEYERLQCHVGFGVTFKAMFNTLKDAYELLNKQKFADAAVRLHNAMTGIRDKEEKRIHPALLLCTLFVVREGEDLSTWDEEDAKKKVSDWEAEGYDMNSFFLLGVSLVDGFQEAYSELTLNTLGQAMEEE